MVIKVSQSPPNASLRHEAGTKNQNHPKLGNDIAVIPIKDETAIASIRSLLATKPAIVSAFHPVVPVFHAIVTGKCGMAIGIRTRMWYRKIFRTI